VVLWGCGLCFLKLVGGGGNFCVVWGGGGGGGNFFLSYPRIHFRSEYV